MIFLSRVLYIATAAGEPLVFLYNIIVVYQPWQARWHVIESHSKVPSLWISPGSCKRLCFVIFANSLPVSGTVFRPGELRRLGACYSAAFSAWRTLVTLSYAQ